MGTRVLSRNPGGSDSGGEPKRPSPVAPGPKMAADVAATMRAYCQHCDTSELLVPEEVYSPAFNFWCKRCQSILILQDDGQALDDEGLRHEAKTRTDTEEPDLPAPTRADRAESVGPSSRSGAGGLDAYAAIAAELDAGVLADSNADALRERPTERHRGAGPIPRTKADTEDPPPPSTGQALLATDARANARSGSPLVARETVRVSRPTTRAELGVRLSEAIAPGAPPLPSWDGGDTQQVRDLAAATPVAPVLRGPLASEEVARGDLPDVEPVDDDPLEEIAVVEPMRGTTGLGSRTYERADSTPFVGTKLSPPSRDMAEPELTPPPTVTSASTAAPLADSPARKAEDLDWYALIDEALPESADSDAEDPSRVVIRLPETMAPKTEADAEQVRQLQATLEARGIHSSDAIAGGADSQAMRFDPLKVPGAARAAGDEAGDASSPDDTRNERALPPVARDREDESPVDPDAPTVHHDSEATSAIRAQILQDPEKTATALTAEGLRADKGPDGKRKSGEAPTLSGGSVPKGKASGIVVEQFNRADLDPSLVCARDPSSPAADYFKQLYQMIFHARNGSSPRTVLVTSALRGEGKTTVAANLAVVAARMPGRGALLIEADPRGGDLLRTFGLRMNKTEGLLEALEASVDPSRYILQFKLGMLDVLPLGVPGSDAAELLSSDRIGEVIRGLASRYPQASIIIDGSSVLHAPDPLVLARHVDGVILVVRADETPREAIERARDLIGPERVLGVVLNHVTS